MSLDGPLGRFGLPLPKGAKPSDVFTVVDECERLAARFEALGYADPTATASAILRERKRRSQQAAYGA